MTFFDRYQEPDKSRYGAGCMVLARKTGRFLLCLRPPHAPGGGTWSLWGGKGEFGEDPRQTALREVFEETGFRWNGDLTHLHHMETRNFSYDTFLMVVDAEFDPARTPESDGFVWVPLDQGPAPLHWGLEQLLGDRTAVNIMAGCVERYSGRPCAFQDVYRD